MIHETTWTWTFHNRSELPIKFSIPSQRICLDRSIFSRQFIDIPESMLVDPPITIAPGEKKPLTANRGEISWHNTKERELGFQIVAKIDETFHILGCAANVREIR
ncbi:hypothetical protein [Rubritalea tangerina]|uniref:hypothetical protein n=1 Tax=Rubritalea tangerina TaxID=430798 RepID=UPI0036224C0C